MEFGRFHPLRLLAVILALSLGAFSVLSPWFRDADGSFSGSILFPASLAIAIATFGVSFSTKWHRSAVWFGLALVGQASTLQLVNAGPSLHYQHLLPVSSMLAPPSVLFLAIIIARNVIVGIAIAVNFRSISEKLLTAFGWWRLALVLIFFLLFTTTLSENVGFFVEESIAGSFFKLFDLANIGLFAWTLPEDLGKTGRQHLERLFGQVSSTASDVIESSAKLVAGFALFAFLVSGALSYFSYERHPHVPDEVAYLLQAKFLANGSITLKAPPVPEAFEIYLMEIREGNWFPVTPPGWALVLSIGVLAGFPWLVNPFLAGINVVLSYYFLREIYPESTARASALLLALSPWHLLLGMSFMTHTLTLTCALLAALGVSRARDRGPAWALVGGLALGFISMIRPLEAVAVGALLGAWAIGIGGKRLKLLALTCLAAGTLISGGAGLAYNMNLTGSPTKFPIMEYTDRIFGPNANAYGFGPDRGMGWELDPNPGHGPVDALINSNLNITSINTELFGWSIGSLLFVLVFSFSGRYRTGDYLMIAVIMLLYLLHFFYYFSGGPDFGARYWFLMILPLIVLSVRGLEVVSSKLAKSPGIGLRTRLTVVALSIMALVTFLPWRGIDKYHNFRGMRPDIRTLAQEYEFGKSLVLIQGELHPDYDSAAVYNPLDLHSSAPVYAFDRNAETRKELLALYGDRRIFIVEGPSRTGSVFRVVAGPLTSEEAERSAR